MTDSLEDRNLTAVARNRPSSDQPIWTEPYPRRVRALLDGVAVVDSTRALLLEARHLPVYYFPPQDVRTEPLEPTDTSTHYPHKGEAAYWSIRVGERSVRDTVWSYQDPLPGRTDIKGCLALYWRLPARPRWRSPTPQGLAAGDRKETLDQVQPRRRGRGEVQPDPGVAGQPGLDGGVLVGGVVVHHHMQLPSRVRPGDQLEEAKNSSWRCRGSR
jgi:uncharacterized protein (DUF427 family)